MINAHWIWCINDHLLMASWFQHSLCLSLLQPLFLFQNFSKKMQKKCFFPPTVSLIKLNVCLCFTGLRPLQFWRVVFVFCNQLFRSVSVHLRVASFFIRKGTTLLNSSYWMKFCYFVAFQMLIFFVFVAFVLT